MASTNTALFLTTIESSPAIGGVTSSRALSTRSQISQRSTRSVNHPAPASSQQEPEDDPNQLYDQKQRLPFGRLIAAYLCLCLCYFISYLDMNSVTTALPTIGDTLDAGPTITWAGTAYLLGQTSCQPLYGRISDITGRKPILLFSVACILVGGLLCGFAQTPIWLYVSRAISGIGGGGISSCVAIIVSDLVSLKSRGKYQGFVSLAIAAGSTAGPFVAAGLIRRAVEGWRWAFWIPSIASAACLVLLWFLLPLKPVGGNWREKVSKIDWLGVATSGPGLILMLMPVNSGGSLWPWGSPKTISTLTIGVVLLLVFVAIEAFVAKIPIIPLHVFNHKSSSILLVTGIFHDFVWQSTQYFIPLYFQTVRGFSPLQSATLIVSFLVAQGLAGAASGPVMSKLARYTPVLRTGFALWTLGAGLKLLFDQDTPMVVYIVVLGIEGIGTGWVHQPGLVALQANCKDEDRAVVTGTRNVLRSLGGVAGVAVSTAAYHSVMSSALGQTVPEPLRDRVLDGSWRPGQEGSEEWESDILSARMEGFRTVFIMQIPLMAVCLLGSFFIADLVLQGDAKPIQSQEQDLQLQERRQSDPDSVEMFREAGSPAEESSPEALEAASSKAVAEPQAAEPAPTLHSVKRCRGQTSLPCQSSDYGKVSVGRGLNRAR